MSSKVKAHRRGVMLVISSPSGAGKSTLAKMLIDAFEDVVLSVSATTRDIRPGEIDGKHYHFLDHEQFTARIEKGDFLEWARVFDHFYGTPWADTEALLKSGTDVIFDVDWQGADALHDKMPNDVVSVFILPPSIDDLRNRLAQRPGSTDELVARRMRDARDDVAHWRRYDYCIVNDDVHEAFEELRSVLMTERKKRMRQIHLEQHARSLMH